MTERNWEAGDRGEGGRRRVREGERREGEREGRKEKREERRG